MGMYDSIEVSASALSAERLAMDTIANNIANANTTRTAEGGAFKRQLVVFSQKPEAASGAAAASADGFSSFGAMGTPDSVEGGSGDPGLARAGVEVSQIVQDQTADRLVYDPGNPDADGQGYVHYPNVEVVKEMVDMMAASRAYEANVTAIQEARTQGNATLGLLKS
jgi:flagellar basal-body rod protein FlgC